jgi:hypothetical protein
MLSLITKTNQGLDAFSSSCDNDRDLDRDRALDLCFGVDKRGDFSPLQRKT